MYNWYEHTVLALKLNFIMKNLFVGSDPVSALCISYKCTVQADSGECFMELIFMANVSNTIIKPTSKILMIHLYIYNKGFCKSK